MANGYYGRRSSYYDPIRDLMLQRGDIAAQRAMSSPWAGIVQGAGQAVGGYLQQRAQQKQQQEQAEMEAQRAEARQQGIMGAIGQYDGKSPNRLALELGRYMKPKDALEMAKSTADVYALTPDPTEENANRLESGARSVAKQDFSDFQVMWPAFYGKAAPTAEVLGVPMDLYGPEPTEQTYRALRRAFDLEDEPQKGVVVGGDIVNPYSGELIYEGEQVSDEDAARRAGMIAEATARGKFRGTPQGATATEEYVTVTDTATGERVRVTEREWNEAPRGTYTDMKPVAGSGAKKSQRGEAQQNVAGLIGTPEGEDPDSLYALTLRNTLPGDSGPLAAATGLGATVQKWTRIGPQRGDVELYESQTEGFIPMLARAVGHTGVLTEPDVQKTRKLLPILSGPYADTRETAVRKLERIRRIMAGEEELSLFGGEDQGGAVEGYRVVSAQ